LAYEIINSAQVTPHRLHAFVRLVVRLPDSPRQQLLDLLQPSALLEGTAPDETDIGPDREKQSAAKEVYRAALNCQLIRESDAHTRAVTLVKERYLFRLDLEVASELDNHEVSSRLRETFQSNQHPLSEKASVQVAPVGSSWTITEGNRGYVIRNETPALGVYSDLSDVESVGSFRARMQSALLGVTDENAPNYLLNLYTAWYAAQNERVFSFGVTEFATHFNREISTEGEGQAFNTTKLNGWQDWTAFLGYGWRIRPTSGRRRELLVPDATDRLRPLLPELLPQGDQVVPYRAFADALAQHCPELDNGTLFNRCWNASHPGDVRGNAVSLMLSTALRTLHQSGAIELRREADATELWSLYPAPGYSLPGQITHIRRGTS
jgi:hypothetical protein